MSSERIYRRIMKQSAAGICQMWNFDYIEPSALELLTNMMLTYMNEACRSTKMLADHAGRTMVTPSDVALGLINMGTDLTSFPEFYEKIKPCAPPVQSPTRAPTPSSANAMKIGVPPSRPAHVPSFLPPYPDPHTYIRTEVSGDPDSSYAKGRELSAQNKRNVENSLKNYVLGIYPTICLFADYEQKLKQEARVTLAEAERQRRLRIENLRTKRNMERLDQELNQANGDGLLEDLLEDNDAKPTVSNSNDDDDEIRRQIEVEEMFELKETEVSLVRRKIPSYCHVLEPFPQRRPYLSALVNDETIEEEQNYLAKEQHKEKEEPHSETQDADASFNEESDLRAENPYLNPPLVLRDAAMAEQN